MKAVVTDVRKRIHSMKNCKPEIPTDLIFKRLKENKLGLIWAKLSTIGTDFNDNSVKKTTFEDYLLMQISLLNYTFSGDGGSVILS